MSLAETQGTCRILIVDGAESDRTATRLLLERRRGNAYAIQEVDQGRLAAEACERFQPDCVLLDYRMPDMDGLEVLVQLRRQFGLLKFAVVLQAGLGQEALAIRALKSGAQDYLPKGDVTGEMLERSIRNALDKLALERQKREAEEALAAKEHQIQDILNATPCALYTVDLLEGRSVHVGGFCETLTGLTPAEIDYMGAASFLALIHPNDRGSVQAHVRALRLAGEDEISECRFRIRHKDGRWRWLSTRNRLIARDSKGFGTMVAGAVTDISAFSDLQGSGETTGLGKVQSDLLAVQEAAGIAAFSWDLKAENLSASALLAVLYGRAGELSADSPLLQDQVLDQWVHADDRLRLAGDWTGALTGEPLRTEFRSIWPDGTVHWLRAQGKVSDEAESGPSLLGIVQDITEERTHAEMLRESNEELQRFAYIASHDLQEPLRAVNSFSDLLARKSKDSNAESKQLLEFIRQGGARMQALVSDLLTFSRIMQADGEQRERVDCAQVLTDVLEGMQPSIAESGAEIQVDALPVIQANPQHMEQLFGNLLSNAVRFRTDRKPVIRVVADTAGSHWRFCVSDNGIGFEMIYAARIFEAFRRLHSRTQYPGSGIGLALCKKIVERHGGRIWAESEPGVGSKFWFLIRQGLETKREA